MNAGYTIRPLHAFMGVRRGKQLLPFYLHFHIFGLCRHFLQIHRGLDLQSADTMYVKLVSLLQFLDQPPYWHSLSRPQHLKIGLIPHSATRAAAAKQQRRQRKETTW